MIPQRNISLISNTLVTAGGRRIPEAVIERDYMLAWFLTGLAGHPLRDVLAFKGGTALRRCWFEGYRFSEDLDFTLTRPITLEDILAGLGEIFAAVETACGL
ncbi:nucleotidyl transferase AbiEii/AbiGii toxin family protein, partial [Acidithiobacillus sulfurivorans]